MTINEALHSALSGAATTVGGLLVTAVIAYSATEKIPEERRQRHEIAYGMAQVPDGPPIVKSPWDLTPIEPPFPEYPPDPPPTEADLRLLLMLEIARYRLERYERYLDAQIFVESRWDPKAVSPVGAAGLAQFMPRTWDDIAPRTDPSCEGVHPYDPDCSLRSQQEYMEMLIRRYDGNVLLAAAAYNAGMGHIDREQRRCHLTPGCNPNEWFGHVEEHCQRAAWACKQTRGYVEHIAHRAEN